MAIQTFTRSERQYIIKNPEWPFSDAVMIGDTLYLSGCIGLENESRVPDRIEDEASRLMDNVRGTLTKAGMTMDDLVSLQVFCTDLSLWDRFNAIYRTYFTKHLPARAFIGCNQLLFGAHFEVVATAARTNNRK